MEGEEFKKPKFVPNIPKSNVPPTAPSDNISQSIFPVLHVKRKRTASPFDELVVEQAQKKQKLNQEPTIEEAFASLSTLGKRKLYRFLETVDVSSLDQSAMVVEPDLKKKRLHTKPAPINQIKSIITPEERADYFIIENNYKEEDEYVIDVYKLDHNVVDDELLHDHPNLYFMESTGENYLYDGPEYDSDQHSEDENGLSLFLIISINIYTLSFS